MDELDAELWKLDPAKTEHNEVAPSQHELAPVYTTANIASDANQLTMELMKSVASRHNLVCLLHEKPLPASTAAENISTGRYRPRPERTSSNPATRRENAQFLLFLCAVVKAVEVPGAPAPVGRHGRQRPPSGCKRSSSRHRICISGG